ncbi:MAG: PKD domain-containing protein [Thermoplasmata archaeon]|nr:MAG: PKD domain-containing protein [Thermoplasmata archaeon]
MSTMNPRVVLAELFTDATDDDCPEADQAMMAIATDYAPNEVIILSWHANDNLAMSEGNTRISWLGVSEYPTAMFDGLTGDIGGGESTDDVKDRYCSHIEQRMEIPSPLLMTVESDYDTQTGRGTVWVNMTAVEDISLPDLMLHTVVFEDDVGPYDGGNGQKVHNFVAREFLETQGAAGAPVSISNGETKEFTYSVDATYAEDKDEIGVMAFVQSHGQVKEVLQSAYVGVPVKANVAPVLSEAQLDTSMGNTEDDEVTFKVKYTDTDDTRNHGPETAYVSYKKGTASAVDAELVPEVDTGNWYEGKYLIYRTKLAAGAYTFKFSAYDGRDPATGDVDWSTTPVNILTRNNLPELKDAIHSPSTGDTTTMFRFEVKYRDMDDVMPTTKNIVIDGTSHAMKTDSSGPWNNWVYFYYETSLNAGSDHKYHFEFADDRDTTRYPSEDAVPNWITGPSVGIPNDVPSLSQPSHSPNEGYRSTEYVFKVTYTDGENDAPLLPRIILDDRQNLMAADLYNYDEGVEFTYTTKLGLGDHKYYFWFNDGTNDVRYPATGYLDGPTVLNQDPVAAVVYPTADYVFEPGDSITFSAIYSWDADMDTLRYEWTSDIDGLLSNDVIFETVLSAGKHLITLEVSDDFGGMDEIKFYVEVKEPYSHAYFESYTVDPDEPVEGNEVRIVVNMVNDGLVDVEEELLEFFVDDVVTGTRFVSIVTGEAHSEEFTFKVTGSHEIKFHIGMEELSFFLKVVKNNDPYSNPGIGDNKGDPIEKPRADEKFKFYAGGGDTDGDPVTYYWDFGDGVTSYEENPEHTYAEKGDYTVTLVVTDTHGATTTKSFAVEVTKPKPAESPGYGAIVASSALLIAMLAAMTMRRRR